MSAPPISDAGPEATYRQRLEDRRETVSRLRRLEGRFIVARVAAFVVGLVVAWAALVDHRFAAAWVLLPVAGFGVAWWAHVRTVRRREHAERAVSWYERGVARLHDDWIGKGNDGARFLDPAHPYVADLDLFGRGSLFELLSDARTRPGEETLASWLAEPADGPEIERRQEAVRELRPKLDLREDLAIEGQDVGTAFDPAPLLDWTEEPPLLRGVRVPVVAGLFALSNLTTLWLWIGDRLGNPDPTVSWLTGSRPFWISVLAASLFALAFRARVARVQAAVDQPERDLLLLAHLLSRLERESFDSPLLAEARAALDTGGRPPSRRIRALARLVEINESRRNMVFAPLSALLLLGTQLAFAMERWRAASGDAIRRWIETVGRIEALSSLARFSFEHPEDPFPVIADGGPRFEGSELGHPLIPDGRSVRNDVTLGGETRLLLVSGSNMSGKSTLLRTVGINVALALAGGTVRAGELLLSPLTVGACMRVQDSLQEGLSHFYAEIRRLRQIVSLGSPERPLLFVLDEILHGTNSHDRRIGAEALIRGLVDRGAIGLVTTHDLALARIADELAPRAINVHFEDHLEGEKVVFDYRLRSGVVRKSNALSLMRAVGLDV